MRYIGLNTWVLIALVLLALASSLLSAVENPNFADAAWRSGWLQNFSTEMVGAIVTFALFELLVGKSQIRKATESERKIQQVQQLIRLRNAQTKEQRQGIVDEMNMLDLLQGAYFGGISLEGISLVEANLKHANMNEVKFDEQTLLPDGINWTPDTDIRKYTHPTHSDFWHPWWV